MEHNIVEFKTQLGQSYPAFSSLIEFLRSNYVMDELLNKNEFKFRRSGKTLVTFYLEEGFFKTLIIFGKIEREKFDLLRHEFSDYIQNYYDSSKTYHDGKWMFIEIHDSSCIEDICNMLKIKKRPNRKA